MRKIPPNFIYLYAKLYGVSSHKRVMFLATAMNISGIKRKGACFWDIFLSYMESARRPVCLLSSSGSKLVTHPLCRVPRGLSAP